MRLGKDLARALDPVIFARDCGLDPDPWQTDLLRTRPPKVATRNRRLIVRAHYLRDLLVVTCAA